VDYSKIIIPCSKNASLTTPTTTTCCCFRCSIIDKTICKLYSHEYLRMPTKDDLKAIEKLHANVHGIRGMFGSIDCMHTYWKNYPVAWQGSYKGKEKKPSIVLEAIVDYHLLFWHAAYGYAGTVSDVTIWRMSPFLEQLLDGTFAELEKHVVPYTIGSEQFNHLYFAVDGIYPNRRECYTVSKSQ
jgi:hypothetical protein